VQIMTALRPCWGLAVMRQERDLAGVWLCASHP
jgi:hypothetical protein